MNKEQMMSVSKALAEQEEKFQNTLDKLNELWLDVSNQKNALLKFKAYMESLPIDSSNKPKEQPKSTPIKKYNPGLEREFPLYPLNDENGDWFQKI